MKVRSLARRLRLSHYVERRPGRVLYAFDADGEPIWMAYDASWHGTLCPPRAWPPAKRRGRALALT